MLNNVILWGSRNIGKTSLLATSFYSAEALALREQFVDIERSNLSGLGSYWDALEQGRPVPATSSKSGYELTMRVAEGNDDDPDDSKLAETLNLVDLAGGQLGDLNRPALIKENSKTIADASGIIFFLPWFKHPRFNANAGLIERTFAHTDLSEKHVCVVFTKCEQHLREEHFATLQNNWWANDIPSDATKSLRSLLEHCKDAVWPTTVFGFLDSRTPRAMISEFGYLAPLNPRPLNVTKPFHWMFERLGYGNTP